MPAVKLENFQGIIPKAPPTLLTPQQAQRADNIRLYGGELLPWRKPSFVYKPANVNPVVSIYHVINTSNGQDRWLTFEADTDVQLGPVPNPQEQRLYMTQAGHAPMKTDWAMLSTGSGPYPASTVPMGVPNPATAPTLAANGTGSGTAITRAYVYTWINMFGTIAEETGPSNAATVNWQSGQTVTVSGFQAPPGAPQNIQYIRIYRTVTGTDPTQVNYYEVAQIPVGTASFVDNISDAAIVGSPLSTVGWGPPPTDLQGLVSLPNGMLAGWSASNQVWFCEPYNPHSWPANYMQPLSFDIVGLAVYEQNLVVMTNTCPYILTGIHPAQMTVTRINLWEPCASKRSIAGDLSGVLYASPNGIVGISSMVQGVITTGLMRRDEWQKWFDAVHMIGAIYNAQYFGFFPDTNGDSFSGGWAIVLDKADNPYMQASVNMDVASFAHAPPCGRMDQYATAVVVDRVNAAMYYVDHLDNTIYQIDGDPLDYQIGDWYSKRFVLARPVNMASIQTDADYEADDTPLYQLVARYETQNQQWLAAHTSGPFGGTLNSTQLNGGGNLTGLGSTMGTLNGSYQIWDVPSIFDFRSVNVKVYADDQLVFTYNPISLDPVRMPANYKCRTWEIEISANFRVRTCALATSMFELGKTGQG